MLSSNGKITVSKTEVGGSNPSVRAKIVTNICENVTIFTILVDKFCILNFLPLFCALERLPSTGAFLCLGRNRGNERGLHSNHPFRSRIDSRKIRHSDEVFSDRVETRAIISFVGDQPDLRKSIRRNMG